MFIPSPLYALSTMRIEDVKDKYKMIHPDYENWIQREHDKKMLLNCGISLATHK